MDLQAAQNLLRETLPLANFRSSAELCLSDSIRLNDDEDDYKGAFIRALEGLRYTIGILDTRYRELLRHV